MRRCDYPFAIHEAGVALSGLGASELAAGSTREVSAAVPSACARRAVLTYAVLRAALVPRTTVRVNDL